MNKYWKQAKVARKARRKGRMCLSKRRYATAEEAYQKGNETYACPYCKGWHRSGSLATFAASLRGRR